MFDVTRSLDVANRIPLKRRACFANALLTMAAYDEYQNGWYVEGFAVPTMKDIRMPVEHGWVQLPDGTIIDPTFAVLGHTDVTYFPAIQMRWNRAEKLILANARLPYMLSEKSFKTLRTRAAYTKSMTKAFAMAFDEDFAKKLKQGFEKRIRVGAEKAKSNHKPDKTSTRKLCWSWQCLRKHS